MKMPKPELYVIVTGNKVRKPDKISLSKEFFEDADIERVSVMKKQKKMPADF